MQTGILIRPYRPADRQAVRDICAATCWMGDPRPELIGDDWVWAEYWTRYFTDVEPANTLVMEHLGDGAVVGYLTGTADERRFLRHTWRILPGIVAHVVRRGLLRRPAARRALLTMLESALFDERCPPSILRRYPATWHFDILPAARRPPYRRRRLGERRQPPQGPQGLLECQECQGGGGTVLGILE